MAASQWILAKDALVAAGLTPVPVVVFTCREKSQADGTLAAEMLRRVFEGQRTLAPRIMTGDSVRAVEAYWGLPAEEVEFILVMPDAPNRPALVEDIRRRWGVVISGSDPQMQKVGALALPSVRATGPRLSKGTRPLRSLSNPESR